MSEQEPVNPERFIEAVYSLNFEFAGELAPGFTGYSFDVRTRALHRQLKFGSPNSIWRHVGLTSRQEDDRVVSVVTLNTVRALPVSHKEAIFETAVIEVSDWVRDNFDRSNEFLYVSQTVQSGDDSNREDRTLDARAFMLSVEKLRHANPVDFLE